MDNNQNDLSSNDTTSNNPLPQQPYQQTPIQPQPYQQTPIQPQPYQHAPSQQIPYQQQLYQQQPYQQQYQQQRQPYPNPYSNRPNDPYSEPMKIKDWIITFLLMMIPIANIVLVLVWAFSNDVNKSKKTFFQASLIMFLVTIVFYFVIAIFFAGLFATNFRNMY